MLVIPISDLCKSVSAVVLFLSSSLFPCVLEYLTLVSVFVLLCGNSLKPRVKVVHFSSEDFYLPVPCAYSTASEIP